MSKPYTRFQPEYRVGSSSIVSFLEERVAVLDADKSFIIAEHERDLNLIPVIVRAIERGSDSTVSLEFPNDHPLRAIGYSSVGAPADYPLIFESMRIFQGPVMNLVITHKNLGRMEFEIKYTLAPPSESVSGTRT